MHLALNYFYPTEVILQRIYLIKILMEGYDAGS